VGLDLALAAQLLLNGVLLGGIYALIAIGLSLIFGVVRVLNMAHGEFVMIGAFGAFWAWRIAGANPLMAFVVLAPLFFAAGYALQYVVLHRAARGRMALEDSSLLLTYGLSISLVAVARFLWSADYRSVPLASGSWALGDVVFPLSKMIAFSTAVVTALALLGLLYFTRTGMAIRATAQSRELASVCGVRTRHVYAVAFGLGTALAACAGMMLSTIYAIYPDMGVDYSVRAFVVIILGGLGSMTGTLLAGLVLGVVETFAAFQLGALPATIVPFVLIVAVLLLRPAGMLAASQREG